MQTDRQVPVEADAATYDFLRMFLSQLGHPFEGDAGS
jgi:hypothetical protein